ncbi:MAG: hypothetical protein JKX81_08675 [Arenicella sp.]|nr:hypothetical protein [Arenicella sp.]
MEEKQTALFNETKAFFAFGTKQFDEAKLPDTTYVNCGAGEICPKENVKILSDGLTKIHENAIKEDIAENGIDKIIIRELYNHECFYTGDISDAISTLKSYNITDNQVQVAYYKELPNSDS